MSLSILHRTLYSSLASPRAQPIIVISFNPYLWILKTTLQGALRMSLILQFDYPMSPLTACAE
jgi:hypothetical protein